MTELSTSVGAAYLFNENRAERRWTALLALAIALFLHIGFVLVMPAELLMTKQLNSSAAEEELEVEFLPPEVIPPEELKFVEANPEAPENKPDRQDQYSFRDQQAADMSDREELLDAPNVDGEEDSQKIVQGSPVEAQPLPPGTYSPQVQPGEGEGMDGGKAGQPVEAVVAPPQPLPTPDFLKQEAIEEDGTASSLNLQGESQEIVENPTPEAPINVYKPEQTTQPTEPAQVGEGAGGQPDAKPVPRARPRLDPNLVTGPLMRSMGSASRRGTLGIDATFSEFGEYQQQFFAALQLGWYQEIEFFQPIDTAARVVVRFRMQADGSIHDIETLHTSAGEVATFICESAISKRSPFRPWTKEMVEVFGQERTLTVSFNYR
ncbi:MAG: hypothetical protein ACPGJU_06125 [Coraliomargarita sp.]